MIEKILIDLRLNKNTTKFDVDRICHTLKYHINQYITKYNTKPKIYIGVDSIEFVMYCDEFNFNYRNNISEELGELFGSSVFLSLYLNKNIILLSCKDIDFNQYIRKLKLNKIWQKQNIIK